MHPRERRKKSRMDVENPVRERREELGLHNAHEAREDDRVDARVLQKLDALVLRDALKLRLPRCAVKVLARDIVLLRPVEDLRVRKVRENQLDLRVERPRLDRIHNRLHVRARAGTKDS